MDDLKSDINLINQRLGFIEQFIKDDRAKYSEHIMSAEGFRLKVTQHDEQIKAIKSELVLTRWMFGVIISVGLAILGKLLLIN